MENRFRPVLVEVGSEAFYDVDSIYKEAFPPNERVPLERIIEPKTHLEGNYVYAVYEGNKCVAFYHIYEAEKFYYLDFFAVLADLRSKGYGAKIMKYLLDSFPDKPIMGLAEYPTEGIDNYEQRIRRIEFYERNNMYNLEKTVEVSDEKYYVLASEKNAPGNEFIDFVMYLQNNADAYV